MLTSKVTREITLPHEPGTVITIRMLSGPQKDHAREVRSEKVQEASTKALARLASLGNDIANAVWSRGTKPADPEPTDGEEPTPLPVLELDPLLVYDRDALCVAGIVGWTYEEPVTPEHILDQDDETLEYVAREIAPKPRSEADRKNGSKPSTPPLTVVE